MNSVVWYWVSSMCMREYYGTHKEKQCNTNSFCWLYQWCSKTLKRNASVWESFFFGWSLDSPTQRFPSIANSPFSPIHNSPNIRLSLITIHANAHQLMPIALIARNYISVKNAGMLQDWFLVVFFFPAGLMMVVEICFSVWYILFFFCILLMLGEFAGFWGDDELQHISSKQMQIIQSERWKNNTFWNE